MTDNDIVKALECCKDIPMCDCCPYLKKCGKLTGDALDLINRQKAEIKRLAEYNENLLSANVALSCDLLDVVKEMTGDE